ncbi:nuclear transport factor 2 family protein [Mycobacterium deserti]|uniref:Nuclear transport factor 2 family protein n=1 Tax=Mycobacterium deserti TaxID=2978347 RepID=A0ABT2MFK6_9MYCO|nr:nuclear transport factor 2 family protein [Mycobacterium deserti]MCT7660746.1 nuclear transport factor 2 family protein [Mycobacterium deserti]
MIDATFILRMDRTRYQAMVARNIALLDALLADDLVYTHSSGRRQTKVDYLRALRENTLTYNKVHHSVDHVTVMDEVAIITGALAGSVTSSGVTRRLNLVTTTLWTKGQGRWRLSIFHSTQAPPVRPVS